MFSLDPNINTAVEHQAERVRAVQAVSLPQKAGLSAPAVLMDDVLSRLLAGRAGRALALACVVIATLLLAYAAR